MPELRKDPVVGRWVIMATERGKRPSDFKMKRDQRKGAPCAFCAGMEQMTPPEVLAYRDNGSQPNGPGWRVRAVSNKFPALRIEGAAGRRGDGLYDLMNGIGAHEVLVESPDHDRGLADLEQHQIEELLWAYRERTLDLAHHERFRYVLIFKNHGRRRVAFENDEFIAASPFAARFPFELWLIPKTHGSHFEHAATSYPGFASAIKASLSALKRSLDDPPFNYIIHSAPLREAQSKHYHWHMEITPALTKVAGFEVGTGFYINPVPPENAAESLREALPLSESEP